jgi:ribosomal-protein-alanine N-acetyltransferase
VLELQRVDADHEQAILAFELANREYFAASISDRGDEFYEQFSERHRALLDEQDSGECVFHVLVDHDGAVMGRVNLYDLADGTATVGYRIARQVAGRGVATDSLREMCRLAKARYGLLTLTAVVANSNLASRRVLEKAGFVAGEDCMVAGRPGVRYVLDLPGQ